MVLDKDRHPTVSVDLFLEDNLVKVAQERLNQSGFWWSHRWWGDSGISWTICKSFAPHFRQI